MANINVQFADGSEHQYTDVPDSVTPEQITQRAAKDFAGVEIKHLARTVSDSAPKVAAAPMSKVDQFLALNHNIGAGMLKGASDIGATLLKPIDASVLAIKHASGIKEGDYPSLDSLVPADRRGAVSSTLQDMGANPDSLAFKGGDIAASIAGTAGAGGMLGKGAEALGMAPKLINSLRTGGFSLGAPTTGGMVANAAARVGGGAVTGAAMTGLSNPSDVGVGAALGGAIPIAGKLSGESGKLIGNYILNPLFKPTSAAIEKLVQDAGGVQQAQAAIEKAIAAGKTLSGQSYTLGQAGKNAGLAATERARSAVSPENFAPVYQAQRDARINALEGISKNDVAIADAVDTRAANAKLNYSAPNDTTFIGDKNLDEMLSAADAGGALAKAKKIATIERRPFSIGDVTEQVPSQSTTLDDIKPLTRWGGSSAQPNETPYDVVGQAIKGGDLHSVKMGIDQAIGEATGHEKAALVQLKSDFTDWMGKQSPDYLKANAQYAADSRPINQMKVAQRLLDSLTGNAYAHGANAGQQASSFYRALKNASSIAKSETGMRQPLNKIFDPSQLATIKQVGHEVAKDVDLQNLGRGVGSDTTQKLARSGLIKDALNMINTSTIGRSAVNLATLGAKGRINNQLDALLLNPEYAGKSISQFTQEQNAKITKQLAGGLLGKPVVRAGLLAVSHK